MTLVADQKADFSAIERALEETGEAPSPAGRGDHRKALKLALSRSGRSRGALTATQAAEAVDAGRNLEGARLALRALEMDEESVTAYLAGAVALERLGMLPQSLEFYEQALARAPGDPTIASLLGGCAARMGEVEISERCYRVAAQLEPSDWVHLSNLGGALRDQGKFDEAVEILRNAIFVHPEAADLWNTLGTVLQEQGRAEEALVFLQEAVRIKPSFARAYHNLGATLADLARYPQARDATEAALRLALAPGDRAEMRAMRSWALLGSGVLDPGWDEYEARLDPLINDAISYRIPLPRWDGEPIAGKNIIIIGEQGVGDEVLFMNPCADLIEAVGDEGKVLIACDRRLMKTFERTYPKAEVRSQISARTGGRAIRSVHEFGEWDRFNYWAPMGSLARHFRKRVADFPQAPGFLKLDAARVAEFQAMLPQDEVLNVGVAWKSLVMTPKRRRYFADIDAWAPVFTAPNVRFFSLQPGDAAGDIAFVREKFGANIELIPGLDLKEDLDGIAALGCALDLTISPMNASSNIAAACGANVWLWHHYGAWAMLGTGQTPWYPQSRTFCAAETGAWADIFEPIGKALRELKR
jgi:tetratricopeptide (TPR) repeat protein